LTLARTLRALARSDAALGLPQEAARLAQQASSIEKRPLEATHDRLFLCPVSAALKPAGKV
jgi:hypothetical protein